MIYLPKTFERYLSALRLYVHISCLRGGGLKQLSQLRIISLAEAFYYKNELTPIDIIKLTNSLLGAAVIILMQRGIRLSAVFSGGGVCLINRRLYTALLSELFKFSSDGCKIKVSTEPKRIIIKAEGVCFSDIIPRLVKALKGFYFFERFTKALLIIIPSEETELKSQPVENEWCYILDRFSPVNIWLLNAKSNGIP